MDNNQLRKCPGKDPDPLKSISNAVKSAESVQTMKEQKQIILEMNKRESDEVIGRVKLI